MERIVLPRWGVEIEWRDGKVSAPGLDIEAEAAAAGLAAERRPAGAFLAAACALGERGLLPTATALREAIEEMRHFLEVGDSPLAPTTPGGLTVRDDAGWLLAMSALWAKMSPAGQCLSRYVAPDLAGVATAPNTVRACAAIERMAKEGRSNRQAPIFIATPMVASDTAIAVDDTRRLPVNALVEMFSTAPAQPALPEDERL